MTQLNVSVFQTVALMICFSIEADCLDIYFDEETKLKLPDWMQLKYAEDVIKVLIETGSH